jgi:hypothetical protein
VANLDETIAANAGGPAEASGDNIRFRQHPLVDQIAADKYLAAKSGAADFRKAFCRIKIVPPGCE